MGSFARTIQYTGSAEDFSWILPIPPAIGADDLAIPEGAESVFDELHQLTDVRFIAPARPECVYVDEQFAFVAMRLLDGATSDAIKPIEITYPAKNPMIPIRLTAVAATTMPVFVWIIADEQAVPANDEHMEIANEELVF